MIRTYLTVTGEIREYEHVRISLAERKKRPQCPLKDCDSFLNKISQYPNETMGYYCKVCEAYFIPAASKIFKYNGKVIKW